MPKGAKRAKKYLREVTFGDPDDRLVDRDAASPSRCRHPRTSWPSRPLRVADQATADLMVAFYSHHQGVG